MLRKLLSRLTYANVVASVALFVALGGSAYAAATVGSANIKDNAVLSRHIKDGQVKNQDLAANSVSTGNVIDGSLLAQDFKPGALAVGGTTQFQTHIDSGVDFNQDGPTVNGVHVQAVCNSGYSTIVIGIAAVGGAAQPPTLYVSGTQTQDSVIKPMHYSGTSDFRATGNSTADIDVIAMSSAVGKWTHFILGGYDGGTSGCNLWDVITAPSN